VNLEGVLLSQGDVEVVPLERITRFYLANHFLLRKAEKQDLVDVAGAICGLYAQVPSTPHLSLWNRVRGFRSDMLDDALYGAKSLVKTWFMRGTLHILPSTDLPTYHNALRTMWFDRSGRHLREIEWPSFEERRRLVYPKIMDALDGKLLRRKELNSRVCSLLKDESKSYGRLFSGWGGIMKETSYLGLTVCGEPSGPETRFARLDKWLPDVDLNETSEERAKEELLMKYLHCYGPASSQDFACWSGLLASETNKIIETNESKLKRVQVDGSKKSLWMLKKDDKTLEKIDLDERVPLRLLPKFDSYLLGHRGRSRIIEEGFLKQVYRPVVGDVSAALLINGRVAGTWSHKKTMKRLRVALRSFEKLEEESVAELKQVVDDLGTFMNIEQTTMVLNDQTT
jgi:hypothetical protein